MDHLDGCIPKSCSSSLQGYNSYRAPILCCLPRSSGHSVSISTTRIFWALCEQRHNTARHHFSTTNPYPYLKYHPNHPPPSNPRSSSSHAKQTPDLVRAMTTTVYPAIFIIQMTEAVHTVFQHPPQICIVTVHGGQLNWE